MFLLFKISINVPAQRLDTIHTYIHTYTLFILETLKFERKYYYTDDNSSTERSGRHCSVSDWKPMSKSGEVG